MAVTTITGRTAVTSGNLDGTAVVMVDDKNTNTRKSTLQLLRTKMFAGGANFTAADPLTVGVVTATGVTIAAGKISVDSAANTTSLQVSSARTTAALVIDAALETLLTGVDIKSNQASTGGAYVVFTNSSGGNAGIITHSGTTAVTYGTTSDVRLKRDFRPLAGVGELIDAIEAVDFEFITDPGQRVRGFKAQQLATVFPEAVAQGRTDDAMWSVDYGRLTPLIVAEIQSLRLRIAKIEP